MENRVNTNLFFIHNFNSLPDLSESGIKLIIIICESNGGSTYNESELLKLTSKLPHVPIIGIIDSSNLCVSEKVFNRIVWTFITIPFTEQDILLCINRFLHKNISMKDNIYSSLKQLSSFDLIRGETDVMFKVKEKILQIAPFDVTVLISGETGTGKELCARVLHLLSKRSSFPFIAVNCGGFPSELFENELFGHKKGAYTHAEENEPGIAAAANKGILFLDEIEALSESMQVKLLRFIEDKKYKPLGQSNYLSSDVRIITAAKENLMQLVEQKKFREDLYYRINVVNIKIPPLRERKDDISILLLYFIEKYNQIYSRNVQGITPAAIMKLQHHSFPGNVRELENIIQELVVVNQSGWIDVEDLDNCKLTSNTEDHYESFSQTKKHTIENFEKNYLQDVMRLFKGNISHAANYARQDRRAFYKLLKKYNISSTEFKRSN